MSYDNRCVSSHLKVEELDCQENLVEENEVRMQTYGARRKKEVSRMFFLYLISEYARQILLI